MKLNSPKSGSVVAVLVLVSAAAIPAAWAQAGKPAAAPPPAANAPARAANAPAPAAAPAAPVTASAEAAQVADTARPKRRSRANEDARHCLLRPTNTAIIKCAEQYL